MARRNSDSETNYVSIANLRRGDVKPPSLVPNGVWELRCLSAVKKMAQDKDGNEIEAYSFMHEPLRATDSVDPEEANAVDEATGRSPFDGARIFTYIPLYSMADAQRVMAVINAHLPDSDEDEEIEALLKVMKGTTALGNVDRNSWTDKTTQETRVNNKVTGWSVVE